MADIERGFSLQAGRIRSPLERDSRDARTFDAAGSAGAQPCREPD